MSKKITRISFAVLWAAGCIVLVFLLANGYFGGAQSMWNINMDVKVGSELLTTVPSPAEGVKRLTVTAGSPSVQIIAVDGDTFTAHHYGAKDTPADEWVTVRRDGDTLRVEIPRVNRVYVGVWFVNERLVLEVPRDWIGTVNAETSSGSLNIEDSFSWKDTSLQTSSGSLRVDRTLTIDGPFRAKTSSGSLNLDELTAASADLQTSSGSLRANRSIAVTGAFRAQTSSGSLHMDGLTADSAELQTTSGSLNADGRLTLTGALTAETTSGSLRLSGDVQAQSVRASTSSGHLTVNHAETETFDLTSTSGGISGGEISGRGQMKSSSGSIRVDTLRLNGDTDVRATSGSVKLGVPRDITFSFEGNSGSGSINGDYEMYYKDKNNKSAFFDHGQNGAMLRVETSSGSIRISQ